MLSAGILGGPLIGYQQDYAAVNELKEKRSGTSTYDRYKSDDPQAPLPVLPAVAGLDNGKVGVLDNYEAIRTSGETGTLKLEKDLQLDPTSQELKKRLAWWQTEGLPNATVDYPKIQDARLVGGKTAMTWTAAIPAIMALGFLILIGYFMTTGGYKAEVLIGHKAVDEEFTGGTEGPGEG
jgi:hypothetical protein